MGPQSRSKKILSSLRILWEIHISYDSGIPHLFLLVLISKWFWIRRLRPASRKGQNGFLYFSKVFRTTVERTLFPGEIWLSSFVYKFPVLKNDVFFSSDYNTVWIDNSSSMSEISKVISVIYYFESMVTP